jgi:hypothetical protein
MFKPWSETAQAAKSMASSNRQKRMAASLIRRAVSVALLASCCSAAAYAQSYEYSTRYQPNLAQIGVTQTLHSNLRAYIAGTTAAKIQAQNVGIAILDGRADPNHGDLRGRLTISQVYRGTYSTFDSHGTHVAGIAGASANNSGLAGVAPTARLISIPVFDSRGRWIANDLGRNALNMAQSLGAKAVNMSYGPGAKGDVFITGELDIFDDYRNSMVLVRAAGNTGVNAINEYYAGDASTALSHILIVGSVNGSNVISSFSNRPGEACIGPAATCDSQNKMRNFFIVAPGEGIWSDLPNNKIGTMSGTSMASPHVTGAAALVFQNAYAGGTLLTPTMVADILKRSARDLGAAGVDNVYGWGLLDVSAALGPVGSTYVATTSSVTTSTNTTKASVIKKSSSLGKASAFEGILEGMVVFDDYGRGFVMNGVALAAPQSTLADDAVASLGASLANTSSVIDLESGQVRLFSSGESTTGTSGFSFASEGYSISSGAGNTTAYFTQITPDTSATDLHGSYRLGADFFRGSGEIGQSFSSGFFSGADIAVTPGLTLSALYANGSALAFEDESDWTNSISQSADLNNSFFSFGASFKLDQRSEFGLSFGLLREEEAMLGIQSEGAYSLGEATHTKMIGASYSHRITNSLTFDSFAQLGLSDATEAQDSVFSSASDIWSSKFGVSLTSTGVIQDHDAMRLSLISPWRIVEGDVEARVAVGREFDGTVIYETRQASLSSDDTPLDLGLDYTLNMGQVALGGSVWLRDGDVASLSLDEAVVATGLSWRLGP